MKKYPIVIQENPKDCGICCLKMIFEYYGINVSREKLKTKLFQNDNGVSALNIINASKKFGLNAKGVLSELESIPKFPVIAHTILENNNAHYIVIYDIDYKKNKIVLGDPNCGKKELSIEEFKKISTKIFIIFEDKKQKTIKDKRLYKFITNLIKENIKLISKTLVTSLITIILSIISSLYLKTILSTLIANQKYLPIVIIIFAFITTLKNIIEYFKNKTFDNLNYNIDEKINYRTYNHLFKLPYQYLKNKSEGELVEIINDLSSFKDSISKLLISFLIDAVAIITIIIVLTIINGIYLIYILLFITVLMLVLKGYYYEFTNSYHLLKEKIIILSSRIIEAISSIETIKNLNIHQKISNKLNDKFIDYLKIIKDYNRKFNKFIVTKNVIKDISLIILIGFSSVLALKGKIDILDLTFLDSLLYMVNNIIDDMMDNFLAFKNHSVSINKILDMYSAKEEKLDDKSKRELDSIQIENFSLKYCDNSLINKTSIKIDKGDKILITGPSGCGKSSLIRCLLNYNYMYRGKIYINDNNVKQINAYCLRENIVYVSQNEKLFSDTIYNNLTIGSKFVNNIDEVCAITKVDDIINSKNIDYNYFLNEQGRELSGGEKKRLIIARALIKNSNIIVFDESFNEVDETLERTILNNIFKHYPTKTVIVISHRMKNKDLFDKCWKIKECKLIQEGEKE